MQLKYENCVVTLLLSLVHFFLFRLLVLVNYSFESLFQKVTGTVSFRFV